MRLFFVLLLTICITTAYGQFLFRIKGTTADFLNNHKIYLVVEDWYSANRYTKKDSTLVKNNSFYFNGSINKPSEKAQLYTKDIRGFFYFVIDTGMNEILIHTIKPKTPFYKNKLSNSEALHSKSNAIQKEIYNLTNYYYLTKGEPSASNKNIIELSIKSKSELRNKELALIKQNPNTYYSLIHLYYMSGLYRSLTTTELLDAYNTLNDQIRSSALGLEFYEKVQTKKGLEIESMVKSFKVKTNTDFLFSNASLHGKPYLLAFGATWCLPCKEKLPVLKQLYQKYKHKGLEVVYVNLDEMSDKWKSQILKDKLDWINVSENVKWADSEISKLFNVTALPFYLMIDKTGKIVYNAFQLNDGSLKELEKYMVKALQ